MADKPQIIECSECRDARIIGKFLADQSNQHYSDERCHALIQELGGDMKNEIVASFLDGRYLYLSEDSCAGSVINLINTKIHSDSIGVEVPNWPNRDRR